MSRPKLIRSQVVILHTIMSPHCRKGDDGMAIYEAEWDDERVHREAQAANPEPSRPITLSAVKHHRLDIFGRIKPPERASDAGWQAKVDELAARVGKLEERDAEYRRFMVSVEMWARSRGYSPPQGRPQSSPPERVMEVAR